MQINITMLVPDDKIDPDSVGDLTEEAYEELIDMLVDEGFSDISVSKGF